MCIVFRLVHAFTCAGVLPRQYIKFCKFAEFGVVGKWFIQQGKWKLLNPMLVLPKHKLHSVYRERGYFSVVGSLAEESMKRAVDEVMAVGSNSTVCTGVWNWLCVCTVSLPCFPYNIGNCHTCTYL